MNSAGSSCWFLESSYRDVQALFGKEVDPMSSASAEFTFEQYEGHHR